MQFQIYKDFYPTVEKKINSIAKKAAKYGNPFTFKVVDEVIREYSDDSGATAYYPFVVIELEGEAKVGDYQCVAVLEMHKDGNVIRRINKEIDIPERFQHSENICEHCNTKRNRKELYIVYHDKTGEYKQVGSDCLLLYTSGLNPKYAASFYDCITELEENDGVFHSGGTPLYDIESVLEYATEIIAKTGYFNSTSDLPTKNLVYSLTTYQYSSFQDSIDELNDLLAANKIYDYRFCVKDFHKDSTADYVKKVIKYYQSLEPTSVFIHNVQILLKEKYVAYNNFGYLCYLPEGYNRHLKEQKLKGEQNQIETKSIYFGDKGVRYKNQNVLDARMLTGWETQYGTTYLYQFIHDSGSILIWKSSSWFSKEELEQITKIDFTVKEHNEYKGKKQTIITRCVRV